MNQPHCSGLAFNAVLRHYLPVGGAEGPPYRVRALYGTLRAPLYPPSPRWHVCNSSLPHVDEFSNLGVKNMTRALKKEVAVNSLNEREELFCQHYALAGSEFYGQSEKAAIEAGYSPDSARTMGWKLRRRAKVIARIREINQESLKDAPAVLADIDDIRKRARKKGDLSVELRAAELLGKRLGLFLETNIVVDVQKLREFTIREEREAFRLSRIMVETATVPTVAEAIPTGKEAAVVQPENLPDEMLEAL